MDLGPTERLQSTGDDDRPVHALDVDRVGHVEALSSAAMLGLDLETDNFHRYREKVCLLQLSTPDQDWFFDPLADGLPNALRRVLSRPDRNIVVHAAENDVRALARDYDLRLGRVFDTALAARILGLTSFGLKDLLEAELGVVIEKNEQRSDWARRPLELEQLAYAREDVRWLIPLAGVLEDRLEAAGRLSWHEEECERVRHLEPSTKRFDPEAWRKTKSAKALGPRGRSVMSALWRWREAEADRFDIPAVRVAHGEQLARVAKVADAHGRNVLDKVEGFRFLPPGLDLEGLARAVERGLGEPDPGARRPNERRGSTPAPLDEPAKARLSRLRKARDRWSAELGIEPGFLLANQVLERVARAAPEDDETLRSVRGLGSWRVDVLGEEILNAVRL